MRSRRRRLYLWEHLGGRGGIHTAGSPQVDLPSHPRLLQPHPLVTDLEAVKQAEEHPRPCGRGTGSRGLASTSVPNIERCSVCTATPAPRPPECHLGMYPQGPQVAAMEKKGGSGDPMSREVPRES